MSLTTTFILLKAHEPANPPSITDAGSQAGQAFNQVLRFIAGCPGFNSQLFGWPNQHIADNIDMNEYMASIRPGILAMIINWNDAKSADGFLTAAAFKQAFQGFTTFFKVPKVDMVADDLDLSRPTAINVYWTDGEPLQVLQRTKQPLRIAIEHSDEGSEGYPDHSSLRRPSKASGIGKTSGSTHDMSFSIRPVEELADLPTKTGDQYEMDLALMRTRYCSRIKEDLYDMIRARRVD